mgnify:CR=1 FL=1|tara:strand:- start:448 stop:801 length:354 start_codon:yes stop_codon:yes gene_type:complete
MNNLDKVSRPWGNYNILASESFYKVKKIVVNPQSRISYQSHKFRNEIWVIVSGSGLITIDENKSKVNYGSVISIPKGSRHRIENNTQDKPLVFIEIQTGEAFEEEDITRYSDDYGRS